MSLQNGYVTQANNDALAMNLKKEMYNLHASIYRADAFQLVYNKVHYNKEAKQSLAPLAIQQT